MLEFPISKNDLAKEKLVFDFSDDKQLVIYPKKYQKGINNNEEYSIANLSAIYFLASKQFNKYHEVVNMYRNHLNQYADEATDEPTSHMLGSGEDFPYILRDVYNLKRDILDKYHWVLEHATDANRSQFESIWSEKIQWVNNIIEMMQHCSWLDENFEYGSYKNVDNICELFTTFNLD